MRHQLPIILSLLVCAVAPSLAVGESITLEVRAGDSVRANTVVETVLPSSLDGHEHFSLTRLDNELSVPIQVDRSSKPARLVWIVRDPLKPGASRRYRLTPKKGKPESNRVVVLDDKKRLRVRVGDKPVLTYNQAVVPSPDPKHPYYARSGYIHPLYNPSGQVVSDDFNPDHAHQHGIMMAWRKMTFEGRSTDGWDQKAKLGRVEHSKTGSLASGPVFGGFVVRLKHVDLTAPGGEKTALDESWTVRVYSLDEGFLFDITSSQRCATKKPVTVDKIHYGGMMVRGHPDWHTKRNYDFLTSQGKSKANGNQSRPNWVDLFGPVSGKPTGVTVLCHPSNYRFPQPVRLHPTMPYFCFAPEAIGSFRIEPGKPFVSRYRFYVHDGQLDSKLADRLWSDYSKPPVVRVVPATDK